MLSAVNGLVITSCFVMISAVVKFGFTTAIELEQRSCSHSVPENGIGNR